MSARAAVGRSVGLAAAFACLTTAALAAGPRPLVVSIPTARDLPITEASRPFAAADRSLRPNAPLAAMGYVESESLVSGKARLFDWGADGVAVALPTPPQAFTTRILIRKPADKARFSGVVVVEMLNDLRGGDWPMLWGYMHDTIMRNGDAWVGITLPRSSVGLKRFDPQRYAEVSFAPSQPLGCKLAEEGPADGLRRDAPPPEMEEGLRFEATAQVGALLKSAAAGNPLAGYGVKSLILTAQGQEVIAYARSAHGLVRSPGNKPIYDGYLIKTATGLSKLNHCGQAIPITDARAQLRGIDAPVITVLPQADVGDAYALRREDSDRKSDPYRLYEVASATHMDWYPYGSLPALDDARRAGTAQGSVEWPFNFRCTPEIRLNQVPALKDVLDASLVNLEAWIKDGVPPPRAERMAVTLKDDKATVVTDRYGVGLGGLRSVFADAPTVSYVMPTAGPGGCHDLGTSIPLAWPVLHGLYGSPQAYAAKALPMVDGMAAARWLTPGDAADLRKEISELAAPPALAEK